MENSPVCFNKPEILAPAGDKNCFLAALAAGADSVYVGLKQFSARMEAENFTPGELARLVDLAHLKQKRVYVALNVLLKENELEKAFSLIKCLSSQIGPDELIIQDPAVIDLAKQANFRGAIALSTLANVSNPAALLTAQKFGATRVVLPRELSLDEIRLMNDNCPTGLELECFIHGALCYCVSGRCYWSSYLGGKSGLRGRCVQPCRRMYSRQVEQKKAGHKDKKKSASADRFFSCQDLELGNLIKTLQGASSIAAWKIEGRKKGPHYVFHAVTAYRMLRDNPDDSCLRKTALEILGLALGRPGVKARFLPQHNYQPMKREGQTSSGLLAGKISTRQDGASLLKPRFELLPRDYLRIGVEDERWHSTLPVNRVIPKGGTFLLKIPKHKTPPQGTPVFLVDRREPQLQKLLANWQKQLEEVPARQIKDLDAVPELPTACHPKKRPPMYVRPYCKGLVPKGGLSAIWLNSRISDISRTLIPSLCFWLPPVIWPEEESAIQKNISQLWRAGARHFVCNAPWQRSLFPAGLPEDSDLIAGPFCNLGNALALEELKKLSFKAAFASPELPGKDILDLPRTSPLPLGIVLKGWWPVGISRFGLAGLKPEEAFASPKGEVFWTRLYGGNVWLYPAWPLDISEKKNELLKAGYSFFAFLEENIPENLEVRTRPGLFNWEGTLA